MSPKNWIPFLIISSGCLVSISTDIYTPCFLEMCTEYVCSPPSVEWTVNLFFLGILFMSTIYSPLSERLGRRLIFIVSIAIFTASSFLVAISPNIEVLWVLRFLQGASGGATFALGRAVFKDFFTEKEYVRLYTLWGVFLSLSPAIAPAIGEEISNLSSWRLNFHLIGALSFLILVLYIKYFPSKKAEGHQRPSFKESFKDFIPLLKSRTFIHYSLVSGFTLGGLFAFVVTSPYVLQVLLGVSKSDFKWQIIIGVITYIIGAFINRQLILTKESISLLKFGLWTNTFSGIFLIISALVVPNSLLAIRGFSALYCFGMAFVFSNASLGALTVNPKKSNAASALFSIFETGGAFMIMALTSFSFDETVWPLCIFMFIGAILSLILCETAPSKKLSAAS